MGIDQDFPMTSTQLKALIVGLIVMGGFGLALFGGFVPGLKPNYSEPTTLVVDGVRYDMTTAFLTYPSPLQNSTVPQSYSYLNVTFKLWVSNWWMVQGGLVHGNGTEANGSVHSFVLGISYAQHVNTTLFVSPDRLWGVYWPGGLFGGNAVRLLVRT